MRERGQQGGAEGVEVARAKDNLLQAGEVGYRGWMVASQGQMAVAAACVGLPDAARLVARVLMACFIGLLLG